jgi:phage terminase small subunit
MSSQKLTDLQKLFVEHYLIHWNAARAAREAGYSEKSAKIIGFQNLQKPHIRKYIEERLSEAAMSANEVLKRLSDMARGSLVPFINITKDGFVFFDFSHPDAKDYLHLIKKIKTKRKRLVSGRGKDAEVWEHEWVEVELYDAKDALVQLGRHHALFTDNIKSLDLTNLTTDQLERLAKGDNIYDVLANKS